MPLSGQDHLAIERMKVLQPIHDWAGFRDAGLWDRLRTVYAPGATMSVSWFDGTAANFVERCAAMSANTVDPVQSQHVVGTSRIDIRGGRAVADTRTLILLRLHVHGVECDITAVGGFRDHLVRTGGGWLIQRRVAVFEKDALQTVVPGETLPLDRAKFMACPAAYRWCAYAWGERGVAVNTALPAPGSPALATLDVDGAAWLAGGTVPHGS